MAILLHLFDNMFICFGIGFWKGCLEVARILQMLIAMSVSIPRQKKKSIEMCIKMCEAYIEFDLFFEDQDK